MRHFIHYLNRKITTANTGYDSLFYSTDQALDEGFDKPSYHITRSKSGTALQVNAGAVIWLFSALKSPWGSLPPSLDAKFIVERVEKMPDGSIKFHASQDSCWFPLADATDMLKKVETINAKSEVMPLWPNHDLAIGNYIQSIREVHNINLLLAYSNDVQKSGFDFISYRIKDGTKAAFHTAMKLLKNGNQIFWDRYCLPRRLAERREFVSDAKLDEYLIKMIHKSSSVLGINSKLYKAQDSYSLKEATLAIALGKFHQDV